MSFEFIYIKMLLEIIYKLRYTVLNPSSFLLNMQHSKAFPLYFFTIFFSVPFNGYTSSSFLRQLLIIFPAIHYLFSFYVLGYWEAEKNGGCA